MINSFLTKKELAEFNFGRIGKNVLISKRASIYNAPNIYIGDNVRIDDFCILSAGEQGIYIGNYIHIAAYASIIGTGKIVLEDFVSLSGRVSIYSSSDNYTGLAMTNPMVPEDCRRVESGPVILSRHVIAGAGTVILPNVTINEGAAVGALSLINEDCEAFTIYQGVPAKKVGTRMKRFLKFEAKIDR